MSTVTSKFDIRVSNDLRFDQSAMPEDAWAFITRALEFPNPEREAARREHLHGWQRMPVRLKMWDEGRLPRGFAAQLNTGMMAMGIDIDWVDQRADVPIYTNGWKRVKLRDYQEPACEAMRTYEQGIWQAPPASGKTVTVLELMRRVKQRSVVITNKTEIAYQWRDRAKEFLGIDVGILGDGSFEVKDVTVALQQTLWARKDELDEDGFWDMFGLVCLDECHHLPARTFMETVQRFSARYRLGVSGTPERQEMMLPFMEAAIGPIFHVTGEEDLVDAGVIARPQIRVVPTSFRFPYHATHEHDPGMMCLVDGCRRSMHTKVHRNNYSAMIEALVDDDARNTLIASKVAERSRKCQLVLSRRLGHLARLRELCIYKGMDPERLVLFTGRQSGKDRVKIQERASHGNIVLFSTIADEALDIPRLDTLHMAFPAGNVEIVKQQVGRVRRTHKAKSDSVVYDYFDEHVGVLKAQFWRRWQGFYSPGKMEINGLNGKGKK